MTKTITILSSHTANTIARDLEAGCEVIITSDLGDDTKDVAMAAARNLGLRLEWDRDGDDGAEVYRAVAR